MGCTLTRSRYDVGAMDLQEFIHEKYFGNELLWWGIAVAIAIGTAMLLLTLRRFLQGRAKRSSVRTKTRIDDAIVYVLGHTRGWFALAFGLWVGSLVLKLPKPWPTRVSLAIVVVAVAQGGVWISAAWRWYLEERYGDRADPAERTGVTLLRFMGLVVVWSAVLLLTLTAAGVDVTALVAGLGVGGIAVALAVQSILGDLFASVSIVLDKPFAVGEFIIVGSEMGTVKEIGLKTTRVTSLGGEEISFANNDLLNSRIRNYARMRERRVVFTVGVTYDTPIEKVAQIPGWLRSIVESDKRARFDRAHLSEFGPYALTFEVVYNVLGPEFNLHMDVRQGFNLAIMERFAAEEVKFALPTQTIRMVPTDGEDEDEAAPAGRESPRDGDRGDRIIAAGPR